MAESALQFGWYGLGSMGAGMALNLQKHLARNGSSLLYSNRTLSKGEALATAGARSVPDFKSLVQRADVVFTMISNDTVLKELAQEALNAGDIQGKLFIDTSTVHPSTSQEVADLFGSRGASYIASPVFGASAVAAAGTLIFAMAGPASQIERVTPFIDGVMGRKIINCGEDVQKSSLLKITGNIMVIGLQELISEIQVFAEKTGLGTEAAEDFIGNMFGPVAESYSKRLTTGAYAPPLDQQPGFAVSLAIKDSKHAVSIAQQHDMQLPTVNVALNHMLNARAFGGENLDSSSMEIEFQAYPVHLSLVYLCMSRLLYYYSHDNVTSVEKTDAEVSTTATVIDDTIGKVISNGLDAADGDVAEGDVKTFQQHGKRIDPALAFIGLESIQYIAEEGRKILRKIDLRMMPLLMRVYMIQFADKTSLNYASVMGIREDTNLDSNSSQYNWVSSIFYAGYIAWEFPTAYLLRRLPIGKYTSVTILCWGAVLTGHAAANGYSALLALRFLLGMFEATVTPAFVLIISIWYKREEQARRVNAFLSCNGMALLIMAPFAYGLSGVKDAAIDSWQILFLVLGLLTIATSIYLLLNLPDSPLNARFLTHREKQVAVERIRGNFQGVGNRVWEWYQFREAFLDPRTYLYVLFSLLMNIPNGGITTFGSLIIKSFGFSNRLSLLLQMPSGFLDISAKLCFGLLSDKIFDRTLPAIMAILITMVGGIMMICSPQDAKAALLIGYYLISVAGASWGLVMVMISNNTLGYTKKVTVNTLQILAYGAGNWIGPQTFVAADAPEYYHGKLMVAVMYGSAAGVLILIRIFSILENKRRDKAQAAETGDQAVETSPDATHGEGFQDLTDFEQKKFRYVI